MSAQAHVIIIKDGYCHHFPMRSNPATQIQQIAAAVRQHDLKQ